MINLEDVQFQVKDDGATLDLVAYVLVKANAQMTFLDRDKFLKDQDYKSRVRSELADDILKCIYEGCVFENRREQYAEVLRSLADGQRQLLDEEIGRATPESLPALTYLVGVINGMLICAGAIRGDEEIDVIEDPEAYLKERMEGK